MRARDPFSILREAPAGSIDPLWDVEGLCENESSPRPPPGAAGNPASDLLDLANRSEAGDTHARILELLSPSPISIDELVRLAEAPTKEVRIVLLELELAGKLEYSGGARVSLAAR
jgi:DNA processing protein